MSATSATFEAPVPSNLAKAVVYDLAAKVAAKVGYKPGGSLEEVVKGLGGEIRNQSWEEATSGGSLEVYPGEKPAFIIRTSPFAGALRNRFTIAHELGHYFLHSDVGAKRIRARREGTDRVEWEANWFAAGFLMPAEQFKADWAAYGHRMGKMMDLYQVSEPVIEIRRDSLELK